MAFIPRNLSQEQLRSIQLAGLQWTVDHAYRNAPLYRNKFDTAGIKPEDIRSLEEISMLSII